MSIVPYGFASFRVEKKEQPLAIAPVPIRSASMVPEDFVLYHGFPRVPEVFVQATTEISAEGVHYSSRPTREEIFPDGNLVRFIGGINWDTNAYIWSPFVSNIYYNYFLETTALAAPTLIEQSYQIGKEIFTFDSMRFDDDTVMTSNFNNGNDEAHAFMVAMVLDVHEVGQVLTWDDGATITFTDHGATVRITDHPFDLTMPKSPLTYVPIFLVLDVTPPNATVYLGVSPTLYWRGSCSCNERSTGLVFTISGQIDLYGFSIWGDDKPSVADVMAQYSSAYGSQT